MKKNEDNGLLFDKITRLSFIMSILVVFIHANNLKYYGLSDSTNNIAWIVEKFVGIGLGGLAVPTFFMVSGYLFFREMDIGNNKVFSILYIKLQKRIRSILIPYLLWNTFGMFFYVVIPQIPLVGSMMNGVAVELSISNLLKGIFFHEYYFPFWYLASLIILITLTPLMAVILRSNIISIMMLLLLGVGAILGISLPEISCSSAFYFCTGSVLAVNGKKFAETNYSKIAYVTSGGLLLVFAAIRTYGSNTRLSILLTLVSPVLLWIMFSNFKWKITWFHRQSFFIYASHVIIVTSIGKILLKIGWGENNTVWTVGSYVIAPFITLGIIYIIARALNFTKRFYGLICGGRG